MIIIVKYILAIISKFLTITMPCSFCSQPGHYITNCPSPTIDVVYGMCRTEYQNIMLINGLTSQEQERRFTSSLSEKYSLKFLKAVVIKFTSSTGSFNKRELIYILWCHFNYSVIRPQMLNTFNPSLSQDLEDNSVETYTLEWFIDISPYQMTAASNTPIEHPINWTALEEAARTLLNTPTPIEHPIDWTAAEERARTLLNTPTPNDPINWSEMANDIEWSTISPNIHVPNLNDISYIDFMVETLDAFFNRSHSVNYTNPNTNNNLKIVINLTETKKDDEEDKSCPICYEQLTNENEVKLNCEHKFCCECIKNSLNKCINQKCALCRTPSTCYDVKTSDAYNVIAEYNVN